MNFVAVACILLGIGLADSAKPIVKEVSCAKQNWRDHGDASKWNFVEAAELQHKGDTRAVKIADFFVTAEGTPVLCEAKTGGGTFDAYWLTRASEDANRIYMFSGVGKDTLRFGVKGNGAAATKVRVELYSKTAPKGPTVTCGSGPTGKECGFKTEIRDQEDQ